MSRRAWSLTAIALAGFLAGTLWHPLTIPSTWPAALATLGRPPADPMAAADRAFRRCDGRPDLEKRDCYERALTPLAAREGPRAALTALQRLTEMDDVVRTDAHDYAHAIGVAAYDAKRDVPRVFPECGVEFQSGCYHGVIQAYFMRQGSTDTETVRAVCAPWTHLNEYGWLRFQCTHGLGHGLTMLLDHDLPAALGKCDALAEDWDRDACYGGAFMENVVDATQPKHEMGMSHERVMHDAMRPKFKQVDSTDTSYPCSVLGARYQETCWENQASVIEAVAGTEPAKVGRACDRAPAAYIRWCYIGLGTDLNGRTVSDAASGLALCDKTAPKWREWCYVGVAKNLIEVGAQPSAGMRFCRLVTRDEWKIRCYEAVGEEVASVTPDRSNREQYCTEAEAPYREACRFGARVTATRPAGLAAVD